MAGMPLNAFLGFLTQKGLSMPQAIAAATPLLKNGYHSESKLATLTEADLQRMNLHSDRNVRRALLDIGTKSRRKQGKKRSRDADLDVPLLLPAQGPSQEPDFSFDEQRDLEDLASKFVVINRAPVMLAWATVVCERQAFERAEALSLAQAYTELNAQAKGSSLGILPSPTKDPASQPYVDIMGRKVPVIGLQDGKWRGLVDGQQADPARAYHYLKKSFQQQLGPVIGAMRHLANSFEPQDLNDKGYGLYCEFRPAVDKWAAKSEMRLEHILGLRRFLTHTLKVDQASPSKKTKVEAAEPQVPVDEPPDPKPAADGEDEFDHLDWSGFDQVG